MATLASRATSVNKEFTEAKRQRGKTNIDWLRGHLSDGGVGVLLLGGTGPIDFRLRVAQSHLRGDLTPSHWSHVALLGQVDRKLPVGTFLYEISLQPTNGFGFPAARNAIQHGALERYADPNTWPNIAILFLPETVDAKELMAAVERFEKQRVVLDAVQLVIAWLGYAWGVGRAVNPLLDGMGIPSAAMLEVVTGAVGFDLTPGLESRASCPEAIWQAARWWHEYHIENKKGAITGAFHTSHYLLPELDQDKEGRVT